MKSPHIGIQYVEISYQDSPVIGIWINSETNKPNTVSVDNKIAALDEEQAFGIIGKMGVAYDMEKLNGKTFNPEKVYQAVMDFLRA